MATEPIPSLKPEWPPLLDVGLHAFTLESLRSLCVDDPRFSLSHRRGPLMALLDSMVAFLQMSRIEGHLWIDGSFLTEKIEPDDIDFVLRVDGDFYDNATDEQRAAMDNPEQILAMDECHCFPHVYFRDSHPSHALGVFMEAYWIKQWGFARQAGMKGIAVVELAGGGK